MGGDLEACARLALQHNGVNKDRAGAAVLYQKACNGGVPDGCFNLGALYYLGDDVAENRAGAAVLYQKACDGGSVVACRSLGLQYARGDGVAKDLARAAVLYQKACDGESGAACRNLGLQYAKGDGVAKDVARAAVLYQKACDYGSADGCWDLSLQYYHGDGVAMDLTHSAALVQKACDGGVLAADCHTIGNSKRPCERSDSAPFRAFSDRLDGVVAPYCDAVFMGRQREAPSVDRLLSPLATDECALGHYEFQKHLTLHVLTAWSAAAAGAWQFSNIADGWKPHEDYLVCIREATEQVGWYAPPQGSSGQVTAAHKTTWDVRIVRLRDWKVRMKRFSAAPPPSSFFGTSGNPFPQMEEWLQTIHCTPHW